MLYIIFLLVIALGIFLFFQSYTSHVARLGNLIPGPKRVPLIGIYGIPRNGRELLKFQERMIEKYGRIYKCWIGNNLYTSISDARDIEVILNSQSAIDKGRTYDTLKGWLGRGLLTSSGLKWNKRRKALTPAFHFQILEQFIEVYNRKSATLLQVMEGKANGEVFNVQTNISNFTLDVISEAAMGVDLHLQENTESQYLTTVKSMVDFVTSIKFTPWILNKLSMTESKLDKFIKILHEFTNSVIHKKKLERGKSINSSEILASSERKNKRVFLELLLDLAERPDSSVKSHEDIREEVDTIMFEGHDTTSVALSSILHLLGKYPDIQDKVLEEIQKFILSSDYQLTYMDLKDMKYMEMVIKESLRVYPPVPSFSRKLSQDIKLPSGYTLPAGSYVNVDVYQTHRNTKYFPDPEQFKPENFLPQKGRSSYAFIPFSAGPRNCIGQKFAMLEMKATLSKFLYKYKVEYGGSEIIPSVTIVLQSLNGYPIKLSLREKK